uniref:Uncharacterized protein n=1 Tax=Oryzias latipes TaxID=8090 RepID=H2LMZ3_ORYLA
MYEVALWQGYSLHLQQFSSEEITDIRDLEHFKACFFPEGFDVDQDVVSMKVRCCKLGKSWFVCNNSMSAFMCKHFINDLFLSRLIPHLQHLPLPDDYELQCRGTVFWSTSKAFSNLTAISCVRHSAGWGTVLRGSLRHCYVSPCASFQALEYLLWASISVELSVPLMTAKYLPLSVTLYCAVCHCYYDNQAGTKAEVRSRLSASDQISGGFYQSIHRLGSLHLFLLFQLGALVFKRAVFESRRPKYKTRIQPWPRTSTEKLLTSMFDSCAGQFLAILEALWDSSARPLQMRMLGDAELQETALELLSAGICILSGL